MSADLNDAPVSSYSQSDYERAVVNSSLWAAGGDALGWMTELSHGTDGVKRRTGKAKVIEPVTWRRHIGGRSGVKIDLPAGTYSDDTQLRLCVSRSIRGNGAFDVEAFAKIEVTSWQGYCLGAGIGSKAASTNLSKRGVNWFSNFFATGRQKYTAAGGNGAAMRIQPHVWSANGSRDEMILRVMQDAIVTHGHPHGFCGAVFHALCIWNVLAERRIPSLEIAKQFVSYMDKLPAILENDSQITSIWRPYWERETGKSLAGAIRSFQDEALQDISLIEDVFGASMVPDYHDVLSQLGCLTDEYRGSGFKTALAALALSLLHSPENVSDALIQIANELDSDTDTIATMSGALLGALAKHEPRWKIQDIEYLRSEAKRMADIASGASALSFPYPDVSMWKPPANQSDAVVMWEGTLALKGIGVLKPHSKEYPSRTAVWQWFSLLPFRQSVLAKRRSKVQSTVDENQMPRKLFFSTSKSKEMINNETQNNIDLSCGKQKDRNNGNKNTLLKATKSNGTLSLDDTIEEVIKSGFDDATIGRAINQCIDATSSIERVFKLSESIAAAKGNGISDLDDVTNEVIKSKFDDAIIGRAINRCIDEKSSTELAILSALIAKARIVRTKLKSQT